MRKLSFFIEEENEVLQIFKENEDYEIEIINEIIKENEFDILIISESKVSIKNIAETLENINAKEIFYIFKDGRAMTADFGVLKKLGVKSTPVKATPKKIYEFIIEDIYKNIKIESNIFAFYGASAKVGTTITSQGVAEWISENTELKVLFMCLSGTKGDYYINTESTQTLEDIVEKLKHRLLSEKRALSNCIQINKNLQVMLGNENIIKRRDINPYDIENLLKLFRNNFDVVIIDTGSLIELGSTVGVLMQTKNRYLVVDDSMITYKDFSEIRKNVLPKIQVNDFKTIVNKYDEDVTYKDEELAKLYGYEHLTSFPLMDEGKECEYNKKTLASLKNDSYLSGVEKIAEDILSQINVPYNFSKENESVYIKIRKWVKAWL